jgi:hypothetical protein
MKLHGRGLTNHRGSFETLDATGEFYVVRLTPGAVRVVKIAVVREWPSPSTQT